MEVFYVCFVLLQMFSTTGAYLLIDIQVESLYVLLNNIPDFSSCQELPKALRNFKQCLTSKSSPPTTTAASATADQVLEQDYYNDYDFHDTALAGEEEARTERQTQNLCKMLLEEPVCFGKFEADLICRNLETTTKNIKDNILKIFSRWQNIINTGLCTTADGRSNIKRLFELHLLQDECYILMMKALIKCRNEFFLSEGFGVRSTCNNLDQMQPCVGKEFMGLNDSTGTECCPYHIYSYFSFQRSLIHRTIYTYCPRRFLDDQDTTEEVNREEARNEVRNELKKATNGTTKFQGSDNQSLESLTSSSGISKQHLFHHWNVLVFLYILFLLFLSILLSIILSII